MAALIDGGMLHLTAMSGMTGDIAESYQTVFPRPVDTDTFFGREY